MTCFDFPPAGQLGNVRLPPLPSAKNTVADRADAQNVAAGSRFESLTEGLSLRSQNSAQDFIDGFHGHTLNFRGGLSLCLEWLDN